MNLNLHPNLKGPLYRQLFETLRLSIVEGELSYHQQLPPSRELARQLSMSRNTINTAYEMLCAEGYVISRQGSGYFVNARLPESMVKTTGEPTKPSSVSVHSLSPRGNIIAQRSRPVPTLPNPAFQPGLPDLQQFPFQLWQRCVTRCLKTTELSLYKYSDQGGYGPLKQALRSYLQMSRGVRCDAEQIIVVNGSQAGLDLIARMLVDVGDNIAMEEPGYLGAKDGFQAAGAKLIPIRVDEEGLSVKQLNRQRQPIKLLYTTPSYQFPLGHTMSLRRRSDLLQWAMAHRAFIIEDDYDSEFRYRERPLSSLQGLDQQQRVIYLGTLSKVMFPGLRIGYLVVPPALASAFANALRKTGQDAPLPLQAALSLFINEGHFGRHLHKMRKLYGEKQEVLVHLVKQYASDWLSINATAAGMQLPAFFTQGIDQQTLIDNTTKARLVISPLSRYYSLPKQRAGLFLGYAGVPLAEMKKNVVLLAKLFANNRGIENRR